MPTERFIHLQETKQARISEAIIAEFQRTAYGELRISNIARNAKISRASLYTYFPDKEDLFQFALEQIQKQNLKCHKQTPLLRQTQDPPYQQIFQPVPAKDQKPYKISRNQKGEQHE